MGVLVRGVSGRGGRTGVVGRGGGSTGVGGWGVVREVDSGGEVIGGTGDLGGEFMGDGGRGTGRRGAKSKVGGGVGGVGVLDNESISRECEVSESELEYSSRCRRWRRGGVVMLRVGGVGSLRRCCRGRWGVSPEAAGLS
jgi:hypothetical protein